MKKVIAFRLLVIAIFCMASISIKSETTACTVICQCTAQSEKPTPVKLMKAQIDTNSYKPDVFYIII